MTPDPVVIISYARTPMGGFQGALAGASATELGAAAVKAAVDRAGIAADAVEQIFMGCVLPAGVGQLTTDALVSGSWVCERSPPK